MRLLRLAARNVARNLRRSLLTCGVVVFGFAAFVLAGGFMTQSLEGLREGTIRGGVGHLQFARPGFFSGSEDATLEQGIERAEDAARVLRGASEVREVLPRIDFQGLVTNGKRSIPFLGTGLDPEPEARTMDPPRQLAAGAWLHDRQQRGVVLGRGLARALAVEAGDSVTLLSTTTDGTLNGVDAEVVGLAEIPIRELDLRFLATSLALADELLGASGKVSKLVVVLEPGGDAQASLAPLLARLREAGFELEGKTWEELAVFYRQVRLLYLGIFGFMGGILVAVVLLACANTMFMAASERTREIGTLRALGTRAARIRRMFLAEAALLALVGCVAGAVLSLLLRALLNRSGIILPPPPGVSHGMPLHVKIYPWAYATGAAVMMVTLLAAAYLPARRAARMPIVEALAHV